MRYTPPSSGNDLPDAFHAKAMRALAEFRTIATEYAAVLEAQHAALAREEGEALDALFIRGDSLAREAQVCAQRIAPVREALTAGYQGTRAAEVRRELNAIEVQAAHLTSTANHAAAMCVVHRDAIAAELNNMNAQATSHASSPSANAYRALERRPGTLNIAV